MFNYHLFEKIQKQKQDEETNKILDEYQSVKRKEKNKKLVQNYEKRIQKFIIEMASHPITIKDYANAVENPRMELMRETDSKIQGRKGFIFKGFITEKERIKQYLEERKKNSDDTFINSNSNKNKTSVDKKIESIYIQPKMRFKPRTDLERIYDAINDYSYGRVSRKAVTNQLKALDLNYFKKTTLENKSFTEDGGTEPDNRNLKQNLTSKPEDSMAYSTYNCAEDKSGLNITSKYKIGKKRIDNSGAMTIMKEYHIKTHFKAASIVAGRKNPGATVKNLNSNLNFNINNLSESMNKSASKTGKHDDIPAHNVLNKRNSSPNKFNHTSQAFNLYQKFSKKFPLDEEKSDTETNPIILNMNMNPLRKVKNEENCDFKNLVYLKKLSENSKEDIVSNNKRKGVKFLSNLKGGKRKLLGLMAEAPSKFFSRIQDEDFEIKRDDDKIWIDNEFIQKSEMDKIAQKVLTKCNFHHSKKDSKEILKKGTGKTMITSGLTVQDFCKKFKLP